MSNPEEANSCVLDSQETYYEGVANESFKVINETQSMSVNESQDFHLVDSEGDESMVVRTKQTPDGEANPQESVEQMNPQEIPETPQSEEDNAITTNDKEDETTTSDKVIENKVIEKTEGNVSGELGESEKKDELPDEDEVIQGTPPQSYSPSRKAGSVDVTSLKRKAKTVNELPAKIARVTSTEDTTNVKKQLEEEESQQSCESDDSYQDLFKNIDKNVIIEETQETPTNLEFTQNSQKIPTEHATETTDNDKAQERHTDNEHTNQQRDEAFSEKCSDIEKDKNLNVSAKLTDTSANDSTVAIINSTNENDSRLDDNNLSVETKGDAASTSVVIADEKSGIGTLDETESVRNTETVSDENNQVEQSNCIKPAEKIVDDNDEIPSSQTKSRISIELIYEGTNRAVGDGESRSKPQVVQIDDDGENIVLDSSAEMTYDGQSTKTRPEVVQIDDSHEDGERIVLDSIGNNYQIQAMDKSSFESKSGPDFTYNSAESMKESSLDSKLTAEKKLVNGSAESKKSDTDATLSLDSDTFSICDEQILPASVITMHDMKKMNSAKGSSFASKDADNIELISISDHEMSNVEEKNKSDLMFNSTAKTVQVEREIGVYLKLKCLMHVDENTKEPVSKELAAVQCEPVIIESMVRRDSQSSLTDISDNKDSSPGSVNSNPHLYQLNPSRLSIMSSISSSSSASSAASLAMKIALKSGAHFFTMPVGPAKHAKKSTQDVLSTTADKQTLDETYDRLTREWKNHRLLTTTILNYANAELGNITTTTAATVVATSDTFANVSNERLDDHHHHLEKDNMRSSTPSGEPMTIPKMELPITPKSTKKGKGVKRPRSKMTRSNLAQINGENGTDNILNKTTLHTFVTQIDTSPSRKKNKLESTEDKLINGEDVLANSSPRSVLADELIGKTVFAKWSDNIYYPGTVSDRLKTKYKVNFYDGQYKTLIPEFVIPIPKILREGLSVYATTKPDDYSCGIIVNVQTSGNDTYYTVETDEGEQLRVQLQDISLSADQAQVLKEEVESAGNSSLPSTPKALGQVTLDNMVDGKRRSKRIGTPLFSTPKSRSNAARTSNSASKIKAEPSVSGMSAKLKKEKGALSETEGMSSDSNVALAQMQDDEYVLRGVQREINSTPYEQMKGPQSKIKNKARSKKKVEEMNETLGPIPTNSNIFKGISFILTCVDHCTLHRFEDKKMSAASGTETKAKATETDLETEDGTENEAETEYEADWMNQPFVRERLHDQIVAGGGKVYEDFKQIPKDEYENTVLITNVPNITENSIFCLSVDIPVCSHKWIIRCCVEGKMVNKAQYALPNGWSFQKKKYIEKYDVKHKTKPLSDVVVIIPSLAYDGQFATFWRQVCENAGAFAVLIAENSGAMEKMDFTNAVVVSNRKCPLWAINSAIRLNIPLLSTTWVVQCIIEGDCCPHNEHPRYKYNYIQN